ncbi:MAG: DsrE/DsrF/DrsH-like family protein [Bacteroidales bacterium]
METQEKQQKLNKVAIICAKGNLEDVYASLVLANGAVMDGMEAKLFFTFFGLEAVIKKRMNKLQTATVGNPALRMPNGKRMGNLLGLIPGVQPMVSKMMKKQMDELDVPPVDEFLDMITAGGGEVYACQLAVDMFKVKREELSDHVLDVLTVGEFYEKAAGEGSQIIFT